MWRVVLTEWAINDLVALRRWQTQPGAGPTGVERVKGVADAIRGLADHPHRHPPGRHAGTREIVRGGYLVVYEITDRRGGLDAVSMVTVLRVFGPGQARDRL